MCPTWEHILHLVPSGEGQQVQSLLHSDTKGACVSFSFWRRCSCRWGCRPWTVRSIPTGARLAQCRARLGRGGGASAHLQSQPAPHEQDFSHLGQPMVGWLGAEEQGTLANPS